MIARVLWTLAVCAPPALAQADGRADPDTGRDLRHYPPHRFVDYEHMRLDLSIADMDVPRLEATQTLTISPIAEPVELLTLDARLLDIESVTCGVADTNWDYDGASLEIAFIPPLEPGRSYEIVTTYEVDDPPQGLIWTPSSEAWPGRPAQLHTQGEPETNSYWFPCHDFPNERLSTELVVTVPPGFLVSSNGRLVEHRRNVSTGANGDGLAASETYHWLQDRAHVNYLVSLVVGKFDVVDLGTAELPMPVYVPTGRAADARATYASTPRMIDLYETLLDEPYPWDRYAQLVVWNFAAGGMENTSATSLYDTAVLDERARLDMSLDSLIAHELAHQWFGDLVTCRSWEHIWLNEGFASYLESLWWEHEEGPNGYLEDVLANFDAVIRSDDGTAPGTPGMVSKVYDHPWDVFGRRANPYPKGASVLHMLRMRLGDEVFFEGLRVYLDRYGDGLAETRDLRLVLEEVSGEPLERFFEQWCRRPGIPRLDVGVSWDDANGLLRVDVEQTQPIDGYNPAFAFDLPVWIRGSGGGAAGRSGVIHVDGRSASAAFELDAEPAMVVIDPDLDVLAEKTVTNSWVRWTTQLEAGPTLPSRVEAARHLADEHDETTRARLAGVATDANAHPRVREAAAVALGEQRAVAELGAMLRAGVDSHYVRRATVEAIGVALDGADTRSPEARDAIEYVAAHAQGDPSLRVQAEAIRVLGRLDQADRLAIVLAAAATDSQHDTLRQAAISALADMDAPGGLEVVIDLAQPGHLNRTRPRAVGAIATLAHHDPDRAFRAVAPLVEDRERRTWEAAAAALVRLGDPRGVAVLAVAAASKRDPADRDALLASRDELEAKAGG